MKYKQLLDIEERYKKQKSSYDSCLHENEQLKQKIDSLEQDLLSIKSTQNRHQDSQMTIDRLQAELQLSVSPEPYYRKSTNGFFCSSVYGYKST